MNLSGQRCYLLRQNELPILGYGLACYLNELDFWVYMIWLKERAFSESLLSIEDDVSILLFYILYNRKCGCCCLADGQYFWSFLFLFLHSGFVDGYLWRLLWQIFRSNFPSFLLDLCLLVCSFLLFGFLGKEIKKGKKWFRVWYECEVACHDPA